MALAIAAPFFACADVPADLAAHAEAGRTFDAMRAARSDAMPRLADADSAAVLRVLGDVPRFLDGPRFTPNELGALSDLCDRDRSAIVAYIAFGAMQNGQLVMDVMARNATTYQEEIALLQRFQARCIAKQVPLAEALLRQMGEAQASRLRLGGLQRSQAALLQTYMVATGNCAVEAGDAPGAPGYCGVLDTLAELAPVHARAMPLSSRATVASLVTPLIARASAPLKAELQRIADLMAGTRCTGLCLLQPSP